MDQVGTENQVQGKILKFDDVVYDFTLHEQFSALFTLELEVASASPSIAFVDLLDEVSTLTIWRDTEVQRIVNGIVTAVEQGDTGLHQTR